MRTFSLVRNEDETGISGTGVVAQGVVFEDGTVAMRWLTDTASTAMYDNIIDLEKIHGHNGKTEIVWETTYRFRDGELALDQFEGAGRIQRQWRELARDTQ